MKKLNIPNDYTEEKALEQVQKKLNRLGNYTLIAGSIITSVVLIAFQFYIFAMAAVGIGILVVLLMFYHSIKAPTESSYAHEIQTQIDEFRHRVDLYINSELTTPKQKLELVNLRDNEILQLYNFVHEDEHSFKMFSEVYSNQLEKAKGIIDAE